MINDEQQTNKNKNLNSTKFDIFQYKQYLSTWKQSGMAKWKKHSANQIIYIHRRKEN